MTRCKFKCDSKREFKSMDKVLYDYVFSAVYGGGTNPSPENKMFWEWTPSGNLNVTAVKEGSFKIGQEYYIDISEAVHE